MSTVGFALIKINTEQFATVEKEIDAEAELQIQLTAGVSFGIDRENQQLACFLKVQYEFDNTPIIILKMNCEFAISPDSWKEFLEVKKDKIIFPVGFLQHLAVITVGTARGVLHTKTEDSDYNRFSLPTLNVTELVTKDEAFPLEKKKK